MTAVPAIAITGGVRKAYGGLRPLRLQALSIAPGERVELAGLDGPAAEVLVNLITGASLPDDGQIRVFGRLTSDVADGDAWLASLDSFGIVSERAVLLEGAALAQNLALPFTLDIDPLSADTLARVRAQSAACDIAPEWLDQPAGGLPSPVRVRAHLARALALGPRVLLMEHPAAALPPAEREAFGEVLRRVAEARGLTVLVLSKDAAFPAAVHRTLTLEPGTGALSDAHARRGWFR